jgi:hypothetical protein
MNLTMEELEGMAYDLYQVLELTQDATEKEIKAAFFRLVRKYTPEDHPEKFKEIRKARDPAGSQSPGELRCHGAERRSYRAAGSRGAGA